MKKLMVGHVIMRNPDGSFTNNKTPIYENVSDEFINESGFTKADEEINNDIAEALLPHFMEYMRLKADRKRSSK